MNDFTLAEREEMRRLEANLLASIGQPPPERLFMVQAVAISPFVEKAQKGRVPQVGHLLPAKGEALR